MHIEPHRALQSPHLDVLNFLNEATLQYPAAISFAPGRPAEQFFDVRNALHALSHYASSSVAHAPLTPAQEEAFLNHLGQYQKTNGIINELLCRFLQHDEHIETTPDAIMVTNGCQEAISIVLTGLFERERDVLLVFDPTYTGVTGMAALLGIETHPVAASREGIDFAALNLGLQHVSAQGRRPRALYLIPDFNNPLGTSLALADRQRLLQLAEEHKLLLLEDNAYGMFSYDGSERLPTLKALDRAGVVIYLGTFAKILFPSLRMGFLVADQQVTGRDGQERTLAEELSKVKSFLSVSTSAVLQAIAGGLLLTHNCSFQEIIGPKVRFYQANRDCMLASLAGQFADDPLLAGQVRWSRPGGGIFLTVDLPFAFGKEQLHLCAEQYGVICCPMQFFSPLDRGENQVRLSFSSVSQEEIKTGIARFAAFVRAQVARTDVLRP
ncbi:MAG TPA: PLP-dependent aminotransferase family protein [Ktedonobacteraceae bacterium]|jgi:(S)-3,5-dihydroxyphenylglycine transaminase